MSNLQTNTYSYTVLVYTREGRGGGGVINFKSIKKEKQTERLGPKGSVLSCRVLWTCPDVFFQMVRSPSLIAVWTSRFEIHMGHQHMPIQRSSSHNPPTPRPLTHLQYGVFHQPVLFSQVCSPHDHVFTENFGAVVRWVRALDLDFLWEWDFFSGHPGI
jgi:hypothetical protein